MKTRYCNRLLAALLAAATVPAAAQDSNFELGLRANVLVGNGKPTNDVPGYGAFGRFRLNDLWAVGLAVDTSPEFDVERSAELVGLTADANEKVVDNKVSSVAVSGWIERSYGARERRIRWFWQAGLGFNSVDVDAAVGRLAGGGTFDVSIDAGSELLVLVGGGLRVRLGRRWSLETALRIEQHFADWTLTDRVSGRTSTVGDYTLEGPHLALSYRF